MDLYLWRIRKSTKLYSLMKSRESYDHIMGSSEYGAPESHAVGGYEVWKQLIVM
jgi:hypothetical protein